MRAKTCYSSTSKRTTLTHYLKHLRCHLRRRHDGDLGLGALVQQRSYEGKDGAEDAWCIEYDNLVGALRVVRGQHADGGLQHGGRLAAHIAQPHALLQLKKRKDGSTGNGSEQKK